MRNCHFAAGGVGNLACFSHSLAQEDLGMLEANSLNYRWQIKHMNMQGKWCLDFWKSCCLAWQSKKDHIFPNFFHKQVPCSRNFIPSRHAFYGRIAVAAGDVAGPAGRHGSPWLSRCWIFEADQSNTWNLGTVSLQKSKTYFTYLYIMIIQDGFPRVFPRFSWCFPNVFQLIAGLRARLRPAPAFRLPHSRSTDLGALPDRRSGCGRWELPAAMMAMNAMTFPGWSNSSILLMYFVSKGLKTPARFY